MLAGHDLVDLVDEDDAHVLGQLDGRGVDLLLVDQGVAFLLEEDAAGLGDGHFPPAGVLGQDLLEHALQVDVHLLHAHAGEHHGHGPLLDGQFHAALLQLAARQHGPHLLPRPLVAFGRVGAVGRGVEGRRLRGQQVHQPLGGPAPRFLLDALPFPFAHQPDGVLDQLADHALHVAAVVADLGVFRGLDLDERGLGELGQPAGDLGLAHAGRADHHDVLGRHFLPHVAFELLPAPAVADGHRHRPLRRVLSDDVPVQFFHNLPRGQVSHDYFSPPRSIVRSVAAGSTPDFDGNRGPRGPGRPLLQSDSRLQTGTAAQAFDNSRIVLGERLRKGATIRGRPSGNRRSSGQRLPTAPRRTGCRGGNPPWLARISILMGFPSRCFAGIRLRG